MVPPRQLNLSPATKIAQALHKIDDLTGAVIPPITLASTFARDENYQARQKYFYGRDGGPNVEHAEQVVADLENATDSLLFASGMSAIVAMLETLPSGAHVVAPEIMYHGGIRWLQRLQEKGRLRFSQFDQGNPASLSQTLRPGETKLVWIETPTNPNWDITDISSAARAAHQAGARLFVDSTGAPPCTTRALDFGADYAFHSATKYLNGHSDLTAGVISTRQSDALWEDLRDVRSMQGGALAGFESWLLLRGMRTLFLRYEKASANALAIARHFENHPRLSAVLYPGLPDHPGHDIAARQMTGGFGGMLSLLVKGSYKTANDVARSTQVFLPATSLGGVESLIEHRIVIEGPGSLVPDSLLRLSVGIEDASDLIADLEQALERATDRAA